MPVVVSTIRCAEEAGSRPSLHCPHQGLLFTAGLIAASGFICACCPKSDQPLFAISAARPHRLGTLRPLLSRKPASSRLALIWLGYGGFPRVCIQATTKASTTLVMPSVSSGSTACTGVCLSFRVAASLSPLWRSATSAGALSEREE